MQDNDEVFVDNWIYTDEGDMVSFSSRDYGKPAFYEDLGGIYSGTYVFLP